MREEMGRSGSDESGVHGKKLSKDRARTPNPKAFKLPSGIRFINTMRVHLGDSRGVPSTNAQNVLSQLVSAS